MRPLSLLQGLASVTAFLLGGTAAVAGDSLVAVGAGRAGTWSTEVTMANTGDTPYTVQLDRLPIFQVITACPDPCPIIQATVPARGTTPFPESLGTRATGNRFTTLYITPADGTSLPAVRLRNINQASPAQAIALPAYRLSALLARNAAVLVFPGATRSAAGVARSNLALANLYRTDSGVQDAVTLTIEALTQGGASLAIGSVSLAYGQTVYLVDVLGSMGVGALDNGELRVTRTGGSGVFWGTLFTRDDNGAFGVGAGAPPE